MSATYDLKAIAEDFQALSATNLFEKWLRFNLSALSDKGLAKVIVLSAQESTALQQSTRWEVFDQNWSARLCLYDPSVHRRLLFEGMHAPKPRIIDMSALTDRIKELSDRTSNFAETLVASGRRWLSKSARDNFKELMDAATAQPQVVERGDDEIVVVSKRLLQSYADPKSAASLLKTFLHRETSVRPFDLEDTDSGQFEDHLTLPRPH
jgi:hypothetical protein